MKYYKKINKKFPKVQICITYMENYIKNFFFEKLFDADQRSDESTQQGRSRQE